jgi:hypothetical protein
MFQNFLKSNFFISFRISDIDNSFPKQKIYLFQEFYIKLFFFHHQKVSYNFGYLFFKLLYFVSYRKYFCKQNHFFLLKKFLNQNTLFQFDIGIIFSKTKGFLSKECYCSPLRGVHGIKRTYLAPVSCSSHTWFIYNLNTV